MKQASTRDDWAADVLSVIDKVLEIADQTRGSNIKQELDDRKMVKSNNMVTLRVVLHDGETVENYRLDVVASAQFPQIQQRVIERVADGDQTRGCA